MAPEGAWAGGGVFAGAGAEGDSRFRLLCSDFEGRPRFLGLFDGFCMLFLCFGALCPAGAQQSKAFKACQQKSPPMGGLFLAL